MYNKRLCKEPEKIENYEKARKDNFEGWLCHHRLQTWNSDGERRLVDITVDELKALGMYYNRPPEELIFMKVEEHSSLHNKGKNHTDEAKKKIGEAVKGEKNPNYGKQFSDETKKKMSEAHLGKKLSDETRKKLSEAKKEKNNPAFGTRWYNNGLVCVRARECPEGFVPGRLRK
jgi:hypothetical protein